MVDYVTASDAPWNSQRETIQKIIIEDGVTSIGARAFYNCTALAEIDVSNSVLTIGSYAFFGCVALTHVTLPDSIINLNDSAFRGCSALSLLICQSNAPALGKYVFNDTNTALTVKYYENCTGYDATPWINYVCVPMHVGQWIVEQEATCTTDGIMHIDCIYCNATFTDSIEGGHRFADGYCTVCQELQIIGSGKCGDNVYWKLDGTGELTIYGSGKMTNYQNTFSGLVIDPPWEEHWSFINRAVIENGVTSIGVSAFSYCTQMESVVIPDSVTRIEDYAFKQCKKLSTITIPQSVCYIGTDCFWGCVSLTGVYITDIAAWCNVDFDGDFYGYCNPVHYAGLLYLNNQLITHIEIPAGVTQVNDFTFSGCTSLISITLPDSVVKIGEHAFEDCVNLASIDVPDGVSEIGEWAFSNCSALQICKIPEGLTVINRCVFENCISLKEVAIPESVVKIRGYAFRGCSNITNINIPDSVYKIGPGILEDCTNLTLLKAPFVGRNIDGNSIAETKWFPLGSFFGSTSNSDCYCASQYIYDPETGTASSQNYYIPYKLKTVVVTRGDIRYGAFYNCKYLTGITLPTDISGIGSLAFYGCSSLKSITIPNNMTSIGDYAFQNCSNLTHVAFTGTQSQWNSISVGSSNTKLTSATRHYETHFQDVDNCVETGIYCPVCESFITRTAKEGGAHSYTDITDTTCSACDHIRSLTSVSVEKLPEKLGYTVFEDALDITGGQLLLTYDDGDSGTIPMTFDMISGFDNTVIGVQTLTVTYEGKTATFTVEICATMPEKLEVATLPAKLSYMTNAQLDLTGLTLTAYYKDDQRATVSAADVTAQADMTTAGKKTVTVTFQGVAATFEIYVHEKAGVWETVDSSLYPQSNHDYSNNLSETKTFTYPGATSLKITFNSSTSVESNYDYIYIYDGTGIQIAKYTGTEAANKTLTISGDTFSVKLTSDSSQVRYGYAFSSIQANMCAPYHPQITVPGYAATCTQTGLTDGTICEICGEMITTQQEIPVTDHDWAAATCTNPSTCTMCSTTLGEPLGHSGHWVTLIAPTETQSGIKARVCSICGELETAIVFPEIHIWSPWVTVKEPTCLEEGLQMRFCNCGAKETKAKEKAHNYQNNICIGCGALESYYWVLSKDAAVEFELAEDLHVDLNGFDLTGTIITHGYAIYGMDSTTNEYACENMGYFNCVDENGNAIVPETLHQTEDLKRYMSIETDNGYTFHRFYLGITHQTLRPTTTGVGYKAVFYADEMVIAQLDENNAFGFTMQLEGNKAVTAYKDRASFVSGKTVTLRIDNYDIDRYGEAALSAKVMLQLADGMVIESTDCTMTMRSMLEALNDMTLTAEQQTAVKAMIEKFAIIKTWDTENLYA